MENIVPLVLWVIVGVVAFNVLFVATRLWATRDRQPRQMHPRSLAPMYATILAKEYPGRAVRHRRGRIV